MKAINKIQKGFKFERTFTSQFGKEISTVETVMSINPENDQVYLLSGKIFQLSYLQLKLNN